MAFGPGRALWETLISLTLTRAPHGITSKSQDKPSRQPECLLLGRDNGHLAPPDSHLRGSTQAAPSPPVLLRSLPTTGAFSNFPHHPGASQDQRISSGPQQGTSPAGSGLGRGRIGRQERGSPAGKKGAKGKQGSPSDPHACPGETLTLRTPRDLPWGSLQHPGLKERGWSAAHFCSPSRAERCLPGSPQVPPPPPSKSWGLSQSTTAGGGQGADSNKTLLCPVWRPESALPLEALQEGSSSPSASEAPNGQDPGGLLMVLSGVQDLGGCGAACVSHPTCPGTPAHLAAPLHLSSPQGLWRCVVPGGSTGPWSSLAGPGAHAQHVHGHPRLRPWASLTPVSIPSLGKICRGCGGAGQPGSSQRQSERLTSWKKKLATPLLICASRPMADRQLAEATSPLDR